MLREVSGAGCPSVRGSADRARSVRPPAGRSAGLVSEAASEDGGAECCGRSGGLLVRWIRILMGGVGSSSYEESQNGQVGTGPGGWCLQALI